MSDRQKPAAFWALIVFLVAEFLLVAIVTVVLVVDLVTAPPADFASAVAITVIAFLASGWVGAMVVGALRGQAWIRGSAIVWQVLQFAVGIGAFQGAFAEPLWGWPLVISAVITVILLLVKPVVEVTSGRAERTL